MNTERALRNFVCPLLPYLLLQIFNLRNWATSKNFVYFELTHNEPKVGEITAILVS